MKKGIIFDMDGTLWDSAAEVAESWNETVKRAGYDRKPITVKDIQSVMGKTMDVIARICTEAEGEGVIVDGEIYHVRGCPVLPGKQTVKLDYYEL